MSIKIFIGFRVPPDFKQVVPDLQVIPYSQKSYIGRYLNATPTLAQIREETKVIRECFDRADVPFRYDKLPVYLFPQVFLG